MMQIPLSFRKTRVFGKFPIMRLQQVLDNPKLVFHLLKKNLFYKFKHFADDDRYQYFIFLNPIDTFKKIMSDKMSLARFSDGEFEQIIGAGEYPPDSDWCQKNSPELVRDLLRVLSSDHRRLLVAVDPPSTFLANRNSDHSIPFSYNMWIDMRRLMWRYLNKGQEYGHSHLFVPANAPHFDWNIFRDYIKNYNIIIATGNIPSLAHLEIGKSTYFIECGKENAYERKEKIKSDIRAVFVQEKLDKDNTIIFASLGPTATILAYEFLEENIRMWDTGHMFKYAAQKLE